MPNTTLSKAQQERQAAYQARKSAEYKAQQKELDALKSTAQAAMLANFKAAKAKLAGFLEKI